MCTNITDDDIYYAVINNNPIILSHKDINYASDI
jgi:hypothetical protein